MNTKEANKTALITGITGQDGSFLAELLLDKGYTVYGLVRRLSKPNSENISHILDRIHLIDGDLSDQSSILNALMKAAPDEIYNLGAQSFVATSWSQAEFTTNVTGLGALRVFEAARQVEDYIGKDIKIYQASSSEMYGVTDIPQNENTMMNPRSPYGVAKLFAHKMARVYRESYDMFISCGILYNHESERRGIEFVSRKITDAVAHIKIGTLDKLYLGNLDAKRDWGYAKDYVEAMYMMLNNTKHPDDFVIATNENHSVREFVERAFNRVNLDYKKYVYQLPELYRPAEIHELKGDYTKARKEFCWKPKTTFNELVNIMVDSDIERLKKN
ncbi:MAG: GDP-mannose 4,6-dehydratase [Terriglobia bacterium]|jgi:GDPmannose 4,6-dehydratase